MKRNLITKNIDELIKSYMTIYGKKVIEDRAFPAIIDGLKPVQRRILYSMYRNKNINDTKTVKSARVVGNCMGTLHPHGDRAVYETIINMVIPWKNIIPLIKGEGNFSNVDGDPAAAMRYTEITIPTKIAKYLFDDLDITNYKPNYDNSMQEPLYLYPKVPFLLFNGTLGIGFAIKTNILQYNPEEIINLLLFLIENKFWKYSNNEFKELYKEQLLEIFKGPDSSTGCEIKINNAEKEKFLFDYTGGKATYQCKIELNEKKSQIIIKSLIPETTSKTIYNELLEMYINYLDIKSSRKDLNKTLKGNASYLALKEKPYNLSKNDKVEIILQYNKKVDLKEELIKLLEKSKTIKKTFNFNNIFIEILNEENITPVYLSLYNYLILFLNIRRKVIIKRLKKEIEGITKEIEYKNLLLFTVLNLEEIQKLIKEHINQKNNNINLLYQKMQKKFDLNEKEIKTILNFNLLKLANINIEKLKAEIKKLEEEIKIKNEIIKDNSKIYNIIKKELKEFKKDFKEEIKRKSKIIIDTFSKTNTTKEEIKHNVLISSKLLDNNKKIFYIKKVPIDLSKKINLGNYDYHKVLRNNEFISFITNKGKLYNIKISNLDLIDKNLNNYVNLEENEKIIMFLTNDDVKDKLIFVKEDGYIKAISSKDIKEYTSKNINSNGKKLFKNTAINVIEIHNISDYLYKNSYIELITKSNYVNNFQTNEIPIQGLSANGVIGIKLEENDKVIKTNFKTIFIDSVHVWTKEKICSIKCWNTLKNLFNLRKRGYKGKKLQL